MDTARCLPRCPSRSRRLARHYCELLGIACLAVEQWSNGGDNLCKLWVSQELQPRSVPGRRYWLPSLKHADALRLEVRDMAPRAVRRPHDMLALPLADIDVLIRAAAALLGYGLTPHDALTRSVSEFVTEFEAKIERQFLRKISAQYRQHRDRVLAAGEPHPSWPRFLEDRLADILAACVEELRHVTRGVHA